MQVPEAKAGEATLGAVQIAQAAAERAREAAPDGKRATRPPEAAQPTQTVSPEVLKTDEDDAATGVAGFPDFLSSCCPAKSEEADEDEENVYCGSCGSLAGFFAPLQPCWDAFIQCLLGLWQSICTRVQGNVDPVQSFITKWTAPAMRITKKMEASEKARITQEWTNDFMALPEEFQRKAFTKTFMARHPTTVRRDFTKEQVRRETVTEFPVDSFLLRGIQSEHRYQQKQQKELEKEQQKQLRAAEKTGK